MRSHQPSTGSVQFTLPATRGRVTLGEPDVNTLSARNQNTTPWLLAAVHPGRPQSKSPGLQESGGGSGVGGEIGDRHLVLWTFPRSGFKRSSRSSLKSSLRNDLGNIKHHLVRCKGDRRVPHVRRRLQIDLDLRQNIPWRAYMTVKEITQGAVYQKIRRWGKGA